MKKFIKASVRLIAPVYSLAWIYTVDLIGRQTLPLVSDSGRRAPKFPMTRGTSQEILSPLESPGPGGVAFGVIKADIPVCSCELWAGESYSERSIWALGNDEALLVRLGTDPAHQRLGLASCLLRYVEREMTHSGFRRLYAVIWWTNAASVRTFRKVGWKRTGFCIRLQLRFTKREVRWYFRTPQRNLRFIND